MVTCVVAGTVFDGTSDVVARTEDGCDGPSDRIGGPVPPGAPSDTGEGGDGTATWEAVIAVVDGESLLAAPWGGDWAASLSRVRRVSWVRDSDEGRRWVDTEGGLWGSPTEVGSLERAPWELPAWARGGASEVVELVCGTESPIAGGGVVEARSLLPEGGGQPIEASAEGWAPCPATVA